MSLPPCPPFPPLSADVLKNEANATGTEGHDGGGLLGTLPGGLDGSESFLSLNTTVSNPSQLPPTADQTSLMLNFPRWSIPLAKLTPLSTLLSSAGATSRRAGGPASTSTVSLIVCVLGVDQPVLRQRKEQKARGQEGTLWIGKWTVTAPGDGRQGTEIETGSCQVKLWDQMAREWGDERVRKGDVVLLEGTYHAFSPDSPLVVEAIGHLADGTGVKFTPRTTTDPAHITISDQGRPKITVLYRTLPRYHAAHSEYVHAIKDQAGAKVAHGDRLLRPDLRLGRSDMGVRKVAEVARWLAELIGGDAPS